MQRSWLKFGIIVALLVSTGVLWGSRMVWAGPDQSPARQTVPTRVRTDTPVVVLPTPVPPTSTEAVSERTPTAVPTATLTQTLVPTQTATQPAPTPTATRPIPTATPVTPTASPVSSTETPGLPTTTAVSATNTVVPPTATMASPSLMPVPEPAPTRVENVSASALGGNALVVAIGGIMVVILAALVFVLQRSGSR